MLPRLSPKSLLWGFQLATFLGWREATQLNNGRESSTRVERMQLKKITSLSRIAIPANPQLARLSRHQPAQASDMTRRHEGKEKMTNRVTFWIGNLL
jgi:hypothetical protein